jgi:hypothetical protein
MGPHDFDAKITKTADGRPVVTLMTDPNMGEDGADGFLSLVNRGANGRTFKVTKAGDFNDLGAEADLGQLATDRGWLMRLFGPIVDMFGGPGKPTTKGADFAAELLPSAVYDRFYRGIDALESVIYSSLHDEEISDKRATVEIALSQFVAWILEGFDGVGSLSKKDAATVAEHLEAGKLSALEAISLKRGDRFKVIAGPGPATIDKKAPPIERANAGSIPNEDPEMTHEQIQAIAQKAAESAVALAIKFNPATSPADQAEIAQKAAEQVFKAAVAGPAQPAMPTNTFAEQLKGSGFAGRGDVIAALEGALGGKFKSMKHLADTVDRLDGQLNGRPSRKSANGEEIEADPGIVAVFDQLLDGLALAQKGARTPKAPTADTDTGAGGEQPDTTFDGTAFAGFMG